MRSLHYMSMDVFGSPPNFLSEGMSRDLVSTTDEDQAKALTNVT